MANLKKLKDRDRKSRLGTPPTPEEAGDNLAEPEFPLASDKKLTPKRPPSQRTKQLGLIVKPEFHDELKLIAAADKLKMVEVLEKGFELYKAQRTEE